MVHTTQHVQGSTSGTSSRAELWALMRRLWPVFLGNTLEWYEFAVYGYLVVYLKANFFEGSAAATWMGYGASFLMRPMGGIIFGRMADKIGRKPVTMIVLLGMVIATGVQGMLPHVEGDRTWPLYVLICVRLAQGVFIGGEESTVTALLAEEAPMRYKSLGTTMYLSSAFVAFIVTAALIAVLSAILTNSQMMAWGWRLPFLLCIPLGLLAYWGRSKLVESEEFQALRDDADNAEEQRTDCTKIITEHGGNVVLGCAAIVGLAAVFYTSTAWSIAYLKAHGLQHGYVLAVAQLACFLVMTLACGRLGDEIGAGALMMLGTASTMVLGAPVFALMAAFPTNWGVAFLCLGIGYGIPVSLCTAGSLLFCSELFPTNRRSLGLGLTHNLAMSIVGGSASYVAQQSLTFSPLGPGLFISFFGLVSTLAVALTLWARARGRTVTHIRPEPYCELFRGCRRQVKCVAKTPSQKVEV